MAKVVLSIFAAILCSTVIVASRIVPFETKVDPRDVIKIFICQMDSTDEIVAYTPHESLWQDTKLELHEALQDLTHCSYEEDEFQRDHCVATGIQRYVLAYRLTFLDPVSQVDMEFLVKLDKHIENTCSKM